MAINLKSCLPLLALFALVFCPCVLGQQEVTTTDEELKNLDAFEQVNLLKADKAFNAKQYHEAAASYDSFATDFPKSPLAAYASLRRARSLQLDGKVNTAIKAYTEVMEWYKEASKYSGAALYYIGESHKQNGDIELALKAWRKMADDPVFSKHFLAATAINELSENLIKQGQAEKGIGYYQQVAVDFRDSNPDAARAAIAKVIQYYVRVQPDEKKIRSLYESVRGFEDGPIKIEADADKDLRYWEWIRHHTRENARFTEAEADVRTRYCSYWSAILQSKLLDSDDQQVDAANLARLGDKDVTKWTEKLDAQFRDHGKQDDPARVLRWYQLFSAQKEKATEYYNKFDFDKASTNQIRELIRVAYEEVKNPGQGKNAYSKLHLDKMTDEEHVQCARQLWNRDETAIVELCLSMSDHERGKYEMLIYYQWYYDGVQHNAQYFGKAMDMAEELKISPKYSSEAYFRKGHLLRSQGRHQEAITAYTTANNPPENLFYMADCYVQMSKIDNAISTYRQIEAYKNAAPQAAWRASQLFKNSNQKEYINRLRLIVKKYPQSGECSEAHTELERLQVSIAGAVENDEKK